MTQNTENLLQKQYLKLLADKNDTYLNLYFHTIYGSFIIFQN